MNRTSRSTGVRQPNYANVKSRVDSGSSVRKQQHAPAAPSDGFNRLSCKQLLELQSTQEAEVLILDLRDEEEFAQGHLMGAVNYPARLLSRATNYFSADIMAFANRHPARIILLVDANERIAVPAANFFWEKGIDNAYILTGGLVKAAERCPQLLEGPAASTSFSDQLLQQQAMRNTSSGGHSTAHTEAFGRPRSAQSIAASIISSTAHAHAAAGAPSFVGGVAGGPRSGLTLRQSSNGGSFFR